METDAIKRFKRSFLDYPDLTEQNGIDIESLGFLNSEEKKEAEKLLLERINGTKIELRHAVALGELSSKAALRKLNHFKRTWSNESDHPKQLLLAKAIKKIKDSFTPFERFIESYFGECDYATWRDGDDIEVFKLLSEKEKEKAEVLLLAKLESDRSNRCIVGLSELKSKRAVPYLVKMLKSWYAYIFGSYRVSVASALWQIEKYADSASIIINVLKHGWLSYTRQDAAIALRLFNDKDTERALFEALNDKSSNVQYNATRAILLRYDIKGESKYMPHRLAFKVSSKDPSERQQAIDELKKLIASKKQGTNEQMPDAHN